MERHKHTYAIPFIPIVPVPVPMRKDGRHYPKKMEEIRGSRFFLPPTTSRHVTCHKRDIWLWLVLPFNTTREKKHDFPHHQFKTIVHICRRVTTTKKHTHTHKHQHPHQICGKNHPISLSKLYNTPCIYTDPLLFFIHTYISTTRHKFIYTHSSSIHPSIHHKHPHKHTQNNICIETGSIWGRGGVDIYSFLKRKLRT